MTTWLLALIAIGVWVMACETVVFAVVRAARAMREHGEAVKLARRIRAAQMPDAAAPVTLPVPQTIEEAQNDGR